MIGTLLAILAGLWLLGVMTANTFGGLIHILVVMAFLVVVIRLVQGRSLFRG